MKWFAGSGIKRIVKSNLKMSDEFESEAGDFIQYWEDPEELPHMKDCDVIWEEMGAHVDSRSWEQLPLELRRWLQQHRHRGVEIWGNVQEFADVDVAVRRLTEDLSYLTKICGSRDPSPTTPEVKRIWGIILVTKIDPRNYKEDMKFVESYIAPADMNINGTNIIKGTWLAVCQFNEALWQEVKADPLMGLSIGCYAKKEAL